jgi:hypothetical protein
VYMYIHDTCTKGRAEIRVGQPGRATTLGMDFCSLVNLAAYILPLVLLDIFFANKSAYLLIIIHSSIRDKR